MKTRFAVLCLISIFIPSALRAEHATPKGPAVAQPRRPAVQPDSKKIEAEIANLANDDYDVREEASAYLRQQLGVVPEAVVERLQKTRKTSKDLEQKRRLDRLLRLVSDGNLYGAVRHALLSTPLYQDLRRDGALAHSILQRAAQGPAGGPIAPGDTGLAERARAALKAEGFRIVAEEGSRGEPWKITLTKGNRYYLMKTLATGQFPTHAGVIQPLDPKTFKPLQLKLSASDVGVEWAKYRKISALDFGDVEYRAGGNAESPSLNVNPENLDKKAADYFIAGRSRAKAGDDSVKMQRYNRDQIEQYRIDLPDSSRR